jgi:hypothetical protein
MLLAHPIVVRVFPLYGLWKIYAAVCNSKISCIFATHDLVKFKMQKSYNKIAFKIV